MSLERFHRAQADEWSGYATALAEMRQGRKESHWIWYIFPQIAGLGRSSMAQDYALRDLNEALDYLCDPVLRARFEEITDVVADQLSKGTPVNVLMGGPVDAQKLTSSITLFRVAASRLAFREPNSSLQKLAKRCEFVSQHLGAQGYAPCQFTLGLCSP